MNVHSPNPVRMPHVPGPVAGAAERLFAALSAARGSRIFHPQGIAYQATLNVECGLHGVPLLAPGTSHDAAVRFSRGLGLPRGAREFLGLALRIGDEQDVLLASSSRAPLMRMVPLPVRSFFGATLSSLLPFDAGDRVVFVGARVDGAPTGERDQLDELAASRTVNVTFAAAELGGPWRPFGRLELDERLPEEAARALRFDAWRCAGGLVPHGRINALRGPAYRGSRRGRPSG
jgi:hypothetical protein